MEPEAGFFLLQRLEQLLLDVLWAGGGPETRPFLQPVIPPFTADPSLNPEMWRKSHVFEPDILSGVQGAIDVPPSPCCHLLFNSLPRHPLPTELLGVLWPPLRLPGG